MPNITGILNPDFLISGFCDDFLNRLQRHTPLINDDARDMIRGNNDKNIVNLAQR